MNLDSFREARVWAVVGSVHNTEKFAYKIYKYLKSRGLTVYAVDPTGNNVDEDKSYKSLKDLPEKPEAVDMVINPGKGVMYLYEAHDIGINRIWFQPGAESQELIDKASEFKMDIVYKKCVMVDLY